MNELNMFADEKTQLTEDNSNKRSLIIISINMKRFKNELIL